jgi:hypothetical protein
MKRFYGIGILLILISLFFLPALLKPDSVYAPVDIIYMNKPWSEYKKVIPQNLLQSDAEFMFVPFQSFYYEQLHKHHFPLWNPYIYGGEPFFANDQSSMLSIYNLISLLFPFDKGFLIIAMLKLIISGIGVYLLLDLFGLGTYACLWGSIASTFSSGMNIHLFHPATAAGSFIPWFLYWFERLIRGLRTENKKSTAFGFSGLALSIGLSFLAGHAETTAIGILWFFIYAIIRLVLWKKYLLKGLLYTGISIITGMFLASIQIFPLMQILGNGEPFLYRAYFHGVFFHLYDMIMLFVPNIDANPLYKYLYQYYVIQGAGVGVLPYRLSAYAYIGIAPLLLSMYAILNVKKIGRDVIPFILVAFISICVVIGIPPFSWLLKLPLFKATSPFMHLGMAEASLTILAGFGIQHIINTKTKVINDNHNAWPLIMVTALNYPRL